MSSVPARVDMGLHLVCGFDGTRPGDAGVEALRERAQAGQLLGTVLFSYNVESPAQLRELTGYIRSWPLPAERAPLLLMVDQEGGRVQRLCAAKGFLTSPSAWALAQLPPARQREHALAVAAQLRDLDIHVNFGPVCDVATHAHSVIGRAERSFGDSPAAVSEAARGWAEAHAACGVAISLKHYPGLGGARGDTHAGLIDATADWHPGVLLPFERLGQRQPLCSMMSTHMVHNTLEPSGAPLTFSRAVMHTLLREQLGFCGPLLTDDLNMGAMAQHFSLDETFERAVAAGHDVLLVGENEAALGDGRPPRHVPIERLAERAGAAVARAIDAGQLTLEQWQARGRRVARWRDALLAARS